MRPLRLISSDLVGLISRAMFYLLSALWLFHDLLSVGWYLSIHFWSNLTRYFVSMFGEQVPR
ncbi:MAG: hypothetical protein Ct9H300mP30_3460 [Methanobacteriota archaeon]|nr:MAG: hypothetical protein Ct9H300mP30_3460 [Euryarchaeota archaeon]